MDQPKKLRKDMYISLDEKYDQPREIYKIIRIEYGKKINELDILIKSVYPAVNNRKPIYLNEWLTTEDLIDRNYKILKSGKILFDENIK